MTNYGSVGRDPLPSREHPEVGTPNEGSGLGGRPGLRYSFNTAEFYVQRSSKPAPLKHRELSGIK